MQHLTADNKTSACAA